ncbi:MAG: ATP-binding protein [Brevundimonas sp.]|nr:ATP-binding protein [Brevundimonas sp.]
MLVNFDDERLHAIFPANIVIAHSGTIRDFSKAIGRIYPELSIGDMLTDHFDICEAKTNQPVVIGADVQSLVRFDPKSGKVPISGWIVPAGQDYLIAMRITPTNYSLDNTALQMSDFPPGDPVVHGILMASMQRALIEEQSLIALELAKARQKAEQLLTRFSRVAGFMAHDFNNYLSIIRLNCDRLLSERDADLQLIRIVDIIRTTAARGSLITQSLMMLANQREDAVLPVVIDDLVAKNEAFLAIVSGTQAEFKLDLQAAGKICLLSPVMLLNCVINLLVNARDAMPEGGAVTISTSLVPASKFAKLITAPPSGWFVRLCVTDSGMGMTEEVLSQAFEPMFSTKEHGNGLGLASVRDFAVALGGQARAESTPGKGTTVEILLPVCETVPGSEDVATELQSHAPSSAKTIAILVVEDEPYALEALCELLEAAGFKVHGVATVSEARLALVAARFDLLLTDIVLGHDSGVELARDAQEVVPGIGILLMSGYVPPSELLDSNWELIQKPINSEHLINLINAMA